MDGGVAALRLSSLKWAFEEPGSAAAAQLQSAYADGRLELMAPDLLVPEIADVV